MDPARLKADASAALAAGQFARAASLYAAYCASAPRDRQSHLRMGDAWARAGDTPRAIDAYLAAAQGFAEDGFLARAIAASKLVLELDPKHTQMQRILADLYARRAAGGQTLRAMLAGAKHPAEPTGSTASGTAAGTPGVPPGSELPTPTPGPAEREASPRHGPLKAESPSVLVHGSGHPPEALAAHRSPEPVELVVTEYLLEPDPSERTLEDVLRGEAERAAPPGPEAEPGVPLELDAPSAPPPAPELGPRFLELSLDDAPLGLEATPAPPAETLPAPPRAWADEVPAPILAPAELPILGVESVLLADSAGAGELSSPALVGSPDSPGNPPYIDLFADEAPQGAAPPASEDTGVDEARGPVGPLAGPDEELPTADAGPLLLALEELAEHPPPELTSHPNPFVAPAARSVPRAPLFSDLSPEAFVELVERCPLRRFRGGERIVQQGTPGTSFFVICEGRVSVLREDNGVARPVAALEAGEFFGEVALLAGGPRIASVDALADDTQVLEIPGGLLLGLAKRHPGVATALKTFCRQRLLANLLATSPLFRPLDKTERRELAARFRARDALPAESIVNEGTPADGLYVILAGEVEVLREEAELSRLGTGDVFGEMSLLDAVGANATVRALRRTSLLRLPVADLADVLERYPLVRQHLQALRDARAEINARLPFAPGDEPMLVV